MNEKEIRTVSQSVEVRSDDKKNMTIKGYALKFDTWSHDLGGFKETVSREALKDTPLNDVRALFNHDPQKVLGRTKNESLSLVVDSVGLRFDCKFIITYYNTPIYHIIKIRVHHKIS